NANHQGITPENDTSDEAYANWEIKVGGSVDNEFTFKLADFENQMVERVMKMDCQTNPPGGAYIANVNVKGIPLSAVMEKAGVDPSVNAMHSVADDGWDLYPLPIDYVNQNQDNILLVTEINGEKLGMLQGYPVQLWTPTLGGCHYTKRVVELNFTTDPTTPVFFKGFTNIKTGEMFNKPNTALFNYENGTIFPVGKPIDFEGFADAYEVPITAVEISLDKGKTWTTYDLGKTDPIRWVNWKLTYTPEKPGSYLIKVRAIAEDGSVSTDPSQLFFNVK
ncbi:MAG: molybdopterin-dependent oxidoreductase, partial [Raoultibacter sp.]